MVAGGQEVRGNSASTAPQIDGFQEASRCQGPRHFPNLQPGEVNFNLLTRVFLDKSITRAGLEIRHFEKNSKRKNSKLKEKTQQLKSKTQQLKSKTQGFDKISHKKNLNMGKMILKLFLKRNHWIFL